MLKQGSLGDENRSFDGAADMEILPFCEMLVLPLKLKSSTGQCWEVLNLRTVNLSCEYVGMH